MLNKIILITLLFCTVPFVIAEDLPSWGVTQAQFESASGKNKLNDIGREAAKKRWRLVVTAPADWHSDVRKYITMDGDLGINMSFKDTVYESISILAEKDTMPAPRSASSNNNQTAVVNKQVILDKPEIDTAVETVEFDNSSMTSTSNMKDDLMEIDLSHLDDAKIRKGSASVSNPKRPKSVVVAKAEEQVKKVEKPVVEAAQKQVAEVSQKVAQVEKKMVAASTGSNSNSEQVSSDELAAETRKYLQKEYARNAGVKYTINELSSLKEDDIIYSSQGESLILRIVGGSRGLKRYFWYEGDLDLTSEMFEKTDEETYKVISEVATEESSVAQETAVASEPVSISAMTNQSLEDEDELRKKYARNQVVEVEMSPSQLKKNDFLYVKGNTVLVKRDIGRGIYKYFWLQGDVDLNDGFQNLSKGTYKRTQ